MNGDIGQKGLTSLLWFGQITKTSCVYNMERSNTLLGQYFVADSVSYRPCSDKCKARHCVKSGSLLQQNLSSLIPFSHLPSKQEEFPGRRKVRSAIGRGLTLILGVAHPSSGMSPELTMQLYFSEYTVPDLDAGMLYN